MQILLQRDLVTELEKSKDKSISQDKAVHRNLLVERDIPDGSSGKAIAVR